MNNTFDIKRFGLYFKKTIFEQPLQTFGALGLALLSVVLFYSNYDINSLNTGLNRDVFAPVLCIGGLYFVFIQIGFFSNKEHGYSYLTLPVSAFEKWLSIFLTTCVLFPAIFIAFFRVIDTFRVNEFYNTTPINQIQEISNIYNRLKVFDISDPMFLKYISIFMIFSGAMLVLSLYFNKQTLVKALIAIFLASFGFYTFNGMIASWFFGKDYTSAQPFLFVNMKNLDYLVMLPNPYRFLGSILIDIILPSTLWMIGLIRLREKEI